MFSRWREACIQTRTFGFRLARLFTLARKALGFSPERYSADERSPAPTPEISGFQKLTQYFPIQVSLVQRGMSLNEGRVSSWD